MKKLIILLFIIVFPLVGFCDDEPPSTTYIVPGHEKLIGYFNGYKVIACLPPYDVVCYLVTGTPASDRLTITYGNENFQVNSPITKKTDSEGNQIYTFKLVE